MSIRYRKRLSFWKFVLLTSGIGAGVGLLAGLILLEFDAGQIVMIAAATGFGAVVGLVMGIPAELVVRVAAPRLHSRTGAVLFCFILGLVSVLAALGQWGHVHRPRPHSSQYRFVETETGEPVGIGFQRKDGTAVPRGQVSLTEQAG